MKTEKNMHSFSSFLTESKKTIKNFRVTTGLLVMSTALLAQNNVSYNQNSIPVNGVNNSAFGSRALKVNTGAGNTANGYEALFSNQSGWTNTASGDRALRTNTTGYNNTAIGGFALYSNTSGEANSASGYHGLYSNLTGYCNTATGADALYSNTYGNNNFAGGAYALYHNSTGSNNTGVGCNAGPTYGAGGFSNSTAIGAYTLITASNQVRIGSSSVTSIGGYQAWTNISDQRVKKNIEEKVPGLAFINKLRPVTYHLDLDAVDAFSKLPEEKRQKRDATGTTMLHTGLLAQEVEKAANDLGYEFSGIDKPKNSDDLYGLRYSEFTIPLIKAVQELSRENETIKKELIELKKLIKNNSTTGIKNPIELEQSQLYQNVPNPFSESTSIPYSISPSAKKAVLTILSIEGEKVKEYEVNGKGTIDITIGELAAGIYIYSLIVDGDMIDSKKITLTK